MESSRVVDADWIPFDPVDVEEAGKATGKHCVRLVMNDARFREWYQGMDGGNYCDGPVDRIEDRS